MSCPSSTSGALRAIWWTVTLTLALMCAEALALPAVKPQRVVSLDLCTDWMLARHLPKARVAALSPLHRRYPVDWVGLDWPHHDGSLEQVLALKPDLVITGQYNALVLRQRLRALGVRVEVLALPQRLHEVDAYELALLTALGQMPALGGGGAALKASSPVRGRSTRSESAPTGVRPRLLLLGANAIGTGRGTLEDDVISSAGWDNAVEQSGHVVLDLEHVVQRPPDAVLWAAPRHAAQANRFGEHPVLRQVVPTHRWLSSDYWPWQCPGPWTWDLVEQLSAWRQEMR